MTDKISINDLGTSIQITIQETDAAVDISTATSTAILLTKPSGDIEEKTASFLTDGTDGVIAYSTVADDIDQKGIWSYRGKVTFSASQVYYTIDPDYFTVVA